MRAWIALLASAFGLSAAGEEPAVRVKSIQISGQSGMPAGDLLKQVRFLRARTVLPGTGWKLRPEYTGELLDADVHRLQSYLISAGYLDARVQSDPVRMEAGNAFISLKVEAGPRYRVDVKGVDSQPENWGSRLCECLMDERSQSERAGVLDFAASLQIRKAGNGSAVLSWSTQPGTPYRLRRLEFLGNRDLKDATLRRSMLLDEGDLLDSAQLRKSLLRLSESGFIEPLDEHSIQFRLDDRNGFADVVVRIKEQKRGRWSLSGPIGPMSFAGPLQASVSARLPGWGRGLLDLSTYSLSAGVIATAGLPAWGVKAALLPVLALERPYSPIEGWRSGWAFSPAYGWRLMAQTYLSTQASQRLMPYFAGRFSLDPALPVRIARANGDAFLVCERPAPRMAGVRKTLPLAVQVVSAFAAF